MIPLTDEDFALALKYYITTTVTEIDDVDHIIEMAKLWEHDIFVRTFVSCRDAYARVSTQLQLVLENTTSVLAQPQKESINKLNTLKGLVLTGNTISNSSVSLTSPHAKGYYAIWYLTNFKREFLGECTDNQKPSPTDIHADLLQTASNKRLIEVGKEAITHLQTLDGYIWDQLY